MFNAAFDGEKKFNQFLMHSLSPLTSVRSLIIHSITSFRLAIATTFMAFKIALPIFSTKKKKNSL